MTQTAHYHLGSRPLPLAVRWHYVICKAQPSDTAICAAIALYPDCTSFHILGGAAWLQQQWRRRAYIYIEGAQIGMNRVRIHLHPVTYHSGRLVWIRNRRWRQYAC